MDLVTEYRNIVRGYLDRLTDRLIQELKPIVAADFGPTAFLLKFEVDMQQFTRGFPIYWFVLDEDGDDIETEWASNGLLSDIPFTVPEEIVESEKYVDDMETWGVGYEMLVTWASECWRAAGGGDCLYPAYISHHEDISHIDLNTQQEISDDELWARETFDPLPPVPPANEDEFPRRKSPRKYEEQLHLVFLEQNLEVLEQLIASGWDVNYGPYREDISALEFSVMNNQLDVARVLLRHGAGLGNALPIAERIQAHVERTRATTGSRTEMIALLKEYGAS